MNYSKFLQEIRTLRRSRGFSQKEMGERIGITGQMVSAIERGAIELKVRDYIAMCEVLKISPKDLFDGEVSRGECQGVEERLNNLSERDFRIIKDLLMLMELSKNDL